MSLLQPPTERCGGSGRGQGRVGSEGGWGGVGPAEGRGGARLGEGGGGGGDGVKVSVRGAEGLVDQLLGLRDGALSAL